MNASQAPLSESEVDLLAQAQQLVRLADKRLQARTIFLALLEQTADRSAEKLGTRLDAIAGLIELAVLDGQFSSAEESLQFLKKELGRHAEAGFSDATHDRVANTLNRLAETLAELRYWGGVKQVSRLVIRNIIGDSKSAQSYRIRALNNLGSALLAQGRGDDAIHLWQCTIKDYEPNASASCPSQLATIHNNLGELNRLRCNLPRACQHHQRAVELRSSCFPPVDPLVLQSRLNYSQVLLESWEFQAALRETEACLEVNLSELNERQIELLRLSCLRTRALLELGRYVAAETLVNQLLRAIGQLPTVPPRLEAEIHLTRLELAILQQKASVLHRQKERVASLIETCGLTSTIQDARFRLLLAQIVFQDDPAHAEQEIQASLRILKKRIHRNHPLIARAIFTLAQHYAATHREQRAVQTANSAMALIEQAFGERGLPMMVAVVELAEIVVARNQFKSARQLMRLALDIRREHQHAPAVTEFRCLTVLARAYQGLGRFKVAAYFARVAYRQITTQLEFPAAAQAGAAQLALELSAQAGHQTAAIELAEQLIAINTEQYHSEHPAVYKATEQLGTLYAQTNQPELAAPLLSQILGVRCSELGDDSPEAAELMKLTARMLRESGQTDQADEIDCRIDLQSQKANHVLSDLF